MVSLRKSTAYRSPSYSIYLTCVLLSSHCNSNRDAIELLFSTISAPDAFGIQHLRVSEEQSDTERGIGGTR